MRLAIADIHSTYLGQDQIANRHYAEVAIFDGSDNLYALCKASETFEQIREYS
jgi:hypothetical protein